MGNGVLVGVISSDVECPLVTLWGTPTGDRHKYIILNFLLLNSRGISSISTWIAGTGDVLNASQLILRA